MGQGPTQEANKAEPTLSQKAEETIRLFKGELDDQRLKLAMQVFAKKMEAAEGPEKACATDNLDAKKSCQELLETHFKEMGDKADSRHKVLYDLAGKFEKKATEAFEALKKEYSKPDGGTRAAVEKLSKNLTEVIDVYYSYDKINLARQNQLLDMTPEQRSAELVKIRQAPPRPLPESAKPAVK